MNITQFGKLSLEDQRKEIRHDLTVALILTLTIMVVGTLAIINFGNKLGLFIGTIFMAIILTVVYITNREGK